MTAASGTDAADTLTIFAMLSGVRRASNVAPFHGGDTTLMGGAGSTSGMPVPPGGEASSTSST